MMERFVSSGVVTLGQLVRLCGPKLEMVSALASQLGVFSERLLANQLRVWRDQLSQTEQNLLVSYCQSSVLPTDSDPFPAITLTPDFKDCSGVLLNCAVPGGANLNGLTGKMMYQLLVKMVNKAKLRGHADTPWRSHWGLSAEVRPQWRALYKTPLTRKVGDLQWRVLHGVLPVNAFISVLNPSVSECCPFCPERETVFHCFFECVRLTPLFLFLKRLFGEFGEFFSKQVFILGYKYSRRTRDKCQLFNFLLGQAKMAIYISRKNKINGSFAFDVITVLIRMITSRLKIDHNYYRLMNDLDCFVSVWCYKNVLCSIDEEELCFGRMLG